MGFLTENMIDMINISIILTINIFDYSFNFIDGKGTLSNIESLFGLPPTSVSFERFSGFKLKAQPI